jgi:hypothetical protein
MKVAKIISTCFKRGRVRLETQLTGDPLGYFSHSQNFTSVADTINLIKYQIEMETKYNPGVKRDIIIVNGDVGSVEGNKFLEELNNTKIEGGKILTITRNNTGLSFGSFDYAFQKFQNDYDFFFFIEDDMITSKKDYLKIGLNKFNTIADCGFVAYIGISKVSKGWWKLANLNKHNAYVAYGGCGLSSTRILKEIVDKNGCLPHYNKNIDQHNAIAFGEIALSRSFIELGYKLTEIRDEILVTPAYDLMRGIKYKKYPNLKEKLIWFFKFNVYRLVSKSEILSKIYLSILKKLKKL